MATDLTWGDMRNRLVDDYSTVALIARWWLLNLKLFLTGAIGPNNAGVWTVVASSNGVSYGAADYWNGVADIVRATSGAHSWCHLRNTTLGADLVLDAAGSDGNYPLLPVFLSHPWTFGAGSLTARPSHSLEVSYNASGHYFTPNENYAITANAATPFRLHGLLSTRGDFWFLGSHDGEGYVRSAFGFSKLVDLVCATDAAPHAMYFHGKGVSGTTDYPFSMKTWCNSYDDWNRTVPALRCRAWNSGFISNGGGFSQGLKAAYPLFRVDGNWPNEGSSPIGATGGLDPATSNTPLWPMWLGHNMDNAFYKAWKGRWPDCHLAMAYMPTNQPAPSPSAQERLSLNRTWLPFSSGTLLM